MTSTTATSTGYVVDRTGSPRFINRTAATAWLATATDGRALQCPDCTEIHDAADDAFDCCRTGAAIPVRPTAGDPHLFETVPTHELTAEENPMALRIREKNTCNSTRYFTTGRNAKGRFATWDAIRVTVTPRGHWYRSDDPMDAFTNDRVCRGCLHHGHFDYILDRVACTAPATDADIARVLGERPMAEPLVAIRR